MGIICLWDGKDNREMISEYRMDSGDVSGGFHESCAYVCGRSAGKFHCRSRYPGLGLG